MLKKKILKMKPNAHNATAILDSAVQKLYDFSRLSYSNIEYHLIANTEIARADVVYIMRVLKASKKELACLVNLEPNLLREILSSLGITFSEPTEIIEVPNKESSPSQRLAYYSIIGGPDKWLYSPVELVLIRAFLYYSLNHSSVRSDWDFGLKPEKPLIDFKGWANYWLYAKKNKTEARDIFAAYLVNRYKF